MCKNEYILRYLSLMCFVFLLIYLVQKLVKM